MRGFAISILCLITAGFIVGVPPSKDNFSSEESTKQSPSEFSSSSSWGIDSFTNFLAKTNEEINAHIAELTKSATQVASKASSITDSTSTYFSNRALMSRVFAALKRIPAKERTISLMVDAFATAIAGELHEWMPTKIVLPDLEMKIKMKYLCGSLGHISNMKTLQFIRSDYADVNPEDEKIDVVFTFSFQNLHMSYDHFAESTFLTHHVAGTLDLGFDKNEVSFGMDIPNVSVLDSMDLTPECLISVKNFTVDHLDTPNALIEPASSFRTFAEKVVNMFARKHEDEYRNLFRLGVVKSLHELIQSENKWICKTKLLDEIAIADEKNVMKPVDEYKFKKYCGKTTQIRDQTNEKKGNLSNEKDSKKHEEGRKQKHDKSSSVDDM